jgi:hypothetical protein
MNLLKQQLWKRFQRCCKEFPSPGLVPRVSRKVFADDSLPFIRAANTEGVCRYGETLPRAAVSKKLGGQLVLALFSYGSVTAKIMTVILTLTHRFNPLFLVLQKLITESSGQRKALAGNKVHHEICVFGNRISTSQHACGKHIKRLVIMLWCLSLKFLVILMWC